MEQGTAPCSIPIRGEKDPDTYESWERALVSAVGHGCDWTDEKYLRPLLGYIER